jgi:hypothetical protein
MPLKVTASLARNVACILAAKSVSDSESAPPVVAFWFETVDTPVIVVPNIVIVPGPTFDAAPATWAWIGTVTLTWPGYIVAVSVVLKETAVWAVVESVDTDTPSGITMGMVVVCGALKVAKPVLY